jgi:hypothetical protein
LFLVKKDVTFEKGRSIDSQGGSASEAQRSDLEKSNFRKVLAKRGLAL